MRRLTLLDVAQAYAGPAGAPIHSVRRLVDGVPPSGITGASFVAGRLLVAGQGGGPFRVWSIDLTTGARRLEAEREIVGESEGLARASVNGGTLQWLIPPFDPQGRPPTYGPGHSTLLSLRPGPPDPQPPAAPPAPAAAPASSPAGSPSVRLLKRSRATVLRRRRLDVRVSCPAACTVRITARARGRTIGRGAIRRSGIARVRLTAGGARAPPRAADAPHHRARRGRPADPPDPSSSAPLNSRRARWACRLRDVAEPHANVVDRRRRGHQLPAA